MSFEYFKNKKNILKESDKKIEKNTEQEIKISSEKIRQDSRNLRTLVFISSIAIIGWLILFFSTKNLFGLEERIYNIIAILPIVLIMLHAFHEVYALLGSKDKEQELVHLQKEIKALKTFSAIIPTLLFGIGTIFAYEKKIMHKVVPFLVLAAFFGTIIPNLLLYVTFDHEDLDKLFIVTNVDFSITSFAFAYLICTVLVFMKNYEK